LLLGYLGYRLGIWLTAVYGASSLNTLYLTLVGVLTGILLGPRLAHLAERLGAAWRRVPPEVPLAIATGSLVALLAAVLLTTLLDQIPAFAGTTRFCWRFF